MIVIRHKETGEPLLEVAADTLAGADLEGAMLLCADLKGADLRGAHLRVADLCQADLRGATLDKADLRDADATLANLVGAMLRGADLTDARFQGINMGTEGAGLTDFTGAELTRTYPQFLDAEAVHLRRCRDAGSRSHPVRSLRVGVCWGGPERREPEQLQPARVQLQLCHARGCRPHQRGSARRRPPARGAGDRHLRWSPARAGR